jgi:cell division protein FtsB
MPLLEWPPVVAEPPPKPWLLMVSGLALAGLLGYSVLAGWLPARRQADRLRQELNALYRREADLHARLAQLTQRAAAREQQVQALRAEREALARRVADLERELGAVRPVRR